MTLNRENRGFSDFLQFSAAAEWIVAKRMEIDQDKLRTGTAIGCRTSHELQLIFLVK